MDTESYAAKLTSPEMDLFQIFTEIAVIDQLIQNEAGRLLSPELNLPQFSVLNHLTRCGDGVSLARIAQAMQVTKGAMTNTITRLADKGLLEVSPDPLDKRGKRVVLTPSGLTAHQRATELLGNRLAPLKSGVPAVDLRQTRQTLYIIRQWLDAHR